MKLNEVISEDCCIANAVLSSRTEVIQKIADLIGSHLSLSQEEKDTIYKTILKREDANSTGFSHGIALPHCSVAGLSRFIIGIITLENGIDFQSLDGQPSDIFLFLAGPEDQRNQHIRILAAITTMVRRDGETDRLRNARDSRELRQALSNGLIDLEDEDDRGPKSYLLIYVQNESLYEPVLEILTAEPEAAIAVSDVKSAGSVLHRTPLFAAFWDEKRTDSIRRVEAVMPRAVMNHAIRQLEDLADGSSGLQINAFFTDYASGSLDF